MLKSILRSKTGAAIVTGALRAYIRLLLATIRMERRVDPEAAALMESGKPFLIVAWHNRLGLIASIWPEGKEIAMVRSSHGDGRMLGNALSHIITRPIEGSTRRNPMGAMRGMLKAIEDGLPVAVTPDGPRGPRMRCQPGVVEAARRTGVPVVPATCSSRPRIQTRSWDRFLVPLPFTRGIALIGAPLDLSDTGENRERARRRVEDALTELTDSADRLLGLEPIPPAQQKTGTPT